MSVICPRCGKENTVPFSDSVYHTHGFECEDCKKDFGVDDGKKLKEKEDNLLSFSYERKHSNGEENRVLIEEKDGKVLLEPSVLHANKMLEPIEPQDISDMWPKLKTLIFEQLYILDWDKTLVGFITPNEESYRLVLTFKDKEEITYTGENKFPPYLKALDHLFGYFFETGDGTK